MKTSEPAVENLPSSTTAISNNDATKNDKPMSDSTLPASVDLDDGESHESDDSNRKVRGQQKKLARNRTSTDNKGYSLGNQETEHPEDREEDAANISTSANSKQEEAVDKEASKGDRGATPEGIPINLNPGGKFIAQAFNRCAAGMFCSDTRSKLSTGRRCMGCGFCVHPNCGIPLTRTKQSEKKNEYILPAKIQEMCKRCIHDKSWERKVKSAGTKKHIPISAMIFLTFKPWQRIKLCEYINNNFVMSEDKFSDEDEHQAKLEAKQN